MSTNRYEEKLRQLLASVDVQLDGSRPWDIQVHDPRLFKRIFSQGSLGLGEAYMDGWWDCPRLDDFFFRVLRGKLDQAVNFLSMLPLLIGARLFNLQKPSRSYQIAERHYNLGNDLFECMLDKNLTYSCGYWKEADNLDDAQEAKLDLIFRKLDLKPGMRVLDIGCGWGGATRLAAERYGARVVGITVSEEQVRFARQCCRNLPVEIRLQDYRQLNEPFDAVFSIGMFEHVGYKNYRCFFEVVRRCLKPGGLFLLHTIGRNYSGAATDPWISRYIFPNSMLPSVKQIAAAAEGMFVIEDLHNFGSDYDRTLMHWFNKFIRGWEDLKAAYSDRFYRMWTYYLLSCAGAFRARDIQLWQILLSPNGVLGECRVCR